MTPPFLMPNLSETIQLDLSIVARPPRSALRGKLFVHVWVNRARAAIIQSQEVGEDGRITVFTYPRVVTSLKFRDEQGRWEAIERHSVKGPEDPGTIERYIVLERSPLLESQAAARDLPKSTISTSGVREHILKMVTFTSPCTRPEPLVCA